MVNIINILQGLKRNKIKIYMLEYLYGKLNRTLDLINKKQYIYYIFIIYFNHSFVQLKNNQQIMSSNIFSTPNSKKSKVSYPELFNKEIDIPQSVMEMSNVTNSSPATT